MSISEDCSNGISIVMPLATHSDGLKCKQNNVIGAILFIFNPNIIYYIYMISAKHFYEHFSLDR